MPSIPSARLLAPLLLAPLALAQEPELVLRFGDAIPGAGHVTDVVTTQVQQATFWNGALWNVVVHTDDPVAHTVVYDLEAPDVMTGDVLGATGGTITAFRSTTWDPIGAPVYVADLIGGSTRQAVVYGLTPQFLTGHPSLWLPAGSTWRRFDDVQAAFPEPAYLLRAAIDDPLGGTLDRSLAAVVTMDFPGQISQFDLVALEGDLAPGLTRVIDEVRAGRGKARLDSFGRRVVWSCDLDGPSTDDGCVYLTNLGFPPQMPLTTLLAREGSPSPVAGRTWGPLEDIAVDVNRHDSWTLRGQLDASDPASDEVLVRDGVVLAREGGVLPAIAPHPLLSLGRGPGAIDDDGHVLWYGLWDDPTTAGEDEALFLDDHPLVRTGVTTVAGSVLVDIDSQPGSYSIESASGRYVSFVGSLADGTQGLLLIDLNRIQVYCSGKLNSATCLPSLLWKGGSPSASGGSPFEVWAIGILPQTTSLFFYGTTGPAALPFHGGTLCVAPPLRRGPSGISHAGTLCSISDTFDVAAWIASGVDPALVAGQQVHLQMWYRDSGFPPPDDIGLTPGLSFWIGP